MAKRNSPPNSSSDREIWTKAFNKMLRMLKSQQAQLQLLAKDREILEERMKLQHERWVFDVDLLREQISQLISDRTLQDMEHVVETKKYDLILGLKGREAYAHKDKFEKANDELQDFRECFDLLTRECSETKGSEKKRKSLETELRKLRSENLQLSSTKDSEISALLAEKSFIWNQYNKLDEDTSEQLRRKQAELDMAKQEIKQLLKDITSLQTSNASKDKEIELLKNHIAKLEASSAQQNDEISSLSRELELLKKGRNDSATPSLRRCTTRSGTSSTRLKTEGTNANNVVATKVSEHSSTLEKGGEISKRKQQMEITTTSETPKLFTSTFKIPKLKTPSPRVG